MQLIREPDSRNVSGTFTPAEKKKNIAVVGGGPAGITFALIAANADTT